MPPIAMRRRTRERPPILAAEHHAVVRQRQLASDAASNDGSNRIAHTYPHAPDASFYRKSDTVSHFRAK